jgi:hypothetical protein
MTRTLLTPTPGSVHEHTRYSVVNFILIKVITQQNFGCLKKHKA